MNPLCEPPKFGGCFPQAHADRPERPDGQIDGLSSIAVLRPINGLKTALRRTVGRIARWRLRRTVIRELRALSDHQLMDIGLDRSQIVSTVEAVIETGDQPA